MSACAPVCACVQHRSAGLRPVCVRVCVYVFQESQWLDSVSLLIKDTLEGEMLMIDNLSGSVFHHYASPPAVCKDCKGHPQEVPPQKHSHQCTTHKATRDRNIKNSKSTRLPLQVSQVTFRPVSPLWLPLFALPAVFSEKEKTHVQPHNSHLNYNLVMELYTQILFICEFDMKHVSFSVNITKAYYLEECAFCRLALCCKCIVSGLF